MIVKKANQQPLVLHAKSPPKRQRITIMCADVYPRLYKPQDSVNSVTINEPKNSDFRLLNNILV